MTSMSSAFAIHSSYARRRAADLWMFRRREGNRPSAVRVSSHMLALGQWRLGAQRGLIGSEAGSDLIDKSGLGP